MKKFALLLFSAGLGVFIGSLVGLYVSSGAQEEFSELIELNIVSLSLLPINISMGYFISSSYMSWIDIGVVSTGFLYSTFLLIRYFRQSKAVSFLEIFVASAMLCFKSSFSFGLMMSV